MNAPRPAALLLLAVLVAPVPALAEGSGPDSEGPPAFLPLSSDAAAAALRAAREEVAAGRIGAAVDTYQGVVDGPLAERLAPLETPEGVDTYEQARERALREMSLVPNLVQACERRFGDRAREVLDRAVAAGDLRPLRDVFTRYPLTAGGTRAGMILAREAHRRGDPGETLRILDRLELLGRAGEAAGVPRADVLALKAAAAAEDGDAPLFAAVEREAAGLAPGAATAAGGGTPLAEFLASRRRDAGLGASPGPRGPLALLWSWKPDPRDTSPPTDFLSPLPAPPPGLPPWPDHGVAVRDGILYWTDRFRVTAVSLETGATLYETTPVFSGGGERLSGEPVRSHLGEFFAPAVRGDRLVAALDVPGRGIGERRGSLGLFDLDAELRLERTRGGAAEMDFPSLRGRYVYHGRPLVLGDRVYVAATETEGEGEAGGGDVRTHVLGFRASDLAPVFDTFVAYGSGIPLADVAPAGSLGARHGRLYLATNTGAEACLDARTGSVLWACLYPRPLMALGQRMGGSPAAAEVPALWYASPPAFSGRFVAFAPRDSYYLEFLYQLPDRRTGGVRETRRPRDGGAITALWIAPGPPDTFFLAGRSATEEPPLHLLDVDPAAVDPIVRRAALEEPSVAGLPAWTGDAVYAITRKALYRLPLDAADGEVERSAFALDPDAPAPGNLVVLPDRVLSVSDRGILCFGPAKGKEGNDR